ncbi:MAG TPA: hypothetical protein VGN72_19850 [Tepidisphaeraceae bacterium]|jgi:hypothetical protein|nr:hypothetical protein [Tepidisphaeraceae bacterium]
MSDATTQLLVGDEVTVVVDRLTAADRKRLGTWAQQVGEIIGGNVPGSMALVRFRKVIGRERRKTAFLLPVNALQKACSAGREG